MTATTDGSPGTPTHRTPSASSASEPDPVPPGGTEAAAQRAVQRAADHLLARQHPDGWWKGDLETNVTMDAEDLLLRQFLGIRDETSPRPPPAGSAPSSARTAPGPPSTAAPATCPPPSRRMSRCGWPGTLPHEAHMALAAKWSRAEGGVAASRVFTRIWLALFGWWSWDDLPELPPEIIYLPKWMPLNIYSFGCWARQTIVPLTVVGAHRPVRPAPFGIDELHIDPAVPSPKQRKAPLTSWDGVFQRLDQVLHVYRRFSTAPAAPHRDERLRPLDHRAPGVRRLLGRHPAARGLLGDRPAPARLRPGPPGGQGRTGVAGPFRRMARGRRADDRGVPVPGVGHLPGRHRARRRRPARRPPRSGQGRRLDARRADHPARRLVRAAPATRPGRLGVRVPQRQLPGHRRHRRGGPRTAPGRPPGPGRGSTPPSTRPCAGTSACSPGTAPGAPSTPTTPAPSRTGCRSATSARSSTRRPPTSPRTSWRCWPPSAWSTTRTPGAASTGCSRSRRTAAPGSAAGASTTSTAPGPRSRRWPRPGCPPTTRRSAGPCTGWSRCRTPTAAGARTCARTPNGSGSGRGHSTASQTAWALMALLSAGERDSEAVARGVRWLTDTQQEDGSWDEPYFTGTGFPRDFSINYHLYRMVFPLTALGRYVRERALRRGPSGRGSGHRGQHRKGGLVRGPVPTAAAGRVRPADREVRPAQGSGRRAPRAPRSPCCAPAWDRRPRTGPSRQALHDPELHDAAVLTTGFCAGLAPGMRPGDVVVSDDGHESAALAAAAQGRSRGQRTHRAHRHTGGIRPCRAGRRARRTRGDGCHRRGHGVGRDAARRARRRARTASRRPGSSSTRPSSNSYASERFAPGSSHSGCSEILFPPFSIGTALPRSPGGELDGHAAPSDHPCRVVPLRTENGQAPRKVPAHRRARTALRLQPQMRGLRQDPAPGRGAEAAYAGGTGRRRGAGVGRPDGLHRRWRAAHAPADRRDRPPAGGEEEVSSSCARMPC